MKIKRFLCVLAAAVLMLGVFTPCAAAGGPYMPAAFLRGSNAGAQDYDSAYTLTGSYIVPTTGGGHMRVQSSDEGGDILVEYYDASNHIVKTQTVKAELPIFGGFYASADAYYILSGQKNVGESDSVEVFRVTKYDRNWVRLSAAGLSGCNTTEPFYVGTARFAEYGDYLFIHTSHQMYESENGAHNQSNFGMALNTKTMKLEVREFDHASHSLNQFIRVDGDRVIALNHGDGYPRAIVMLELAAKADGSGKYAEYRETEIMKFPGSIGLAVTGASVGALEVSSSHYLVAGNSVEQDSLNTVRQTRNIFVASVNKSTGELKTRWITGYDEGDGTTSTPHMVKIAADRFLLLWTREGLVYYTVIDGSGVEVSTIYTAEGELSDCVPVCADGKVTWYTWSGREITFYDIDTANLDSFKRTVTNEGHISEYTGTTSAGVASFKCKVCGAVQKYGTYTSYDVLWDQTGSKLYHTSYEGPFKKGGKLYVWMRGVNYPTGVELDTGFTVEISDPSVVSYEETSELMGTFTMLKSGKATVKIYPTLNPSASKSFEISVECEDGKHTPVLSGAKAATCTAEGYTGDRVCSKCGMIIEAGSPIPKTAHKEKIVNEKKATATEDGYTGDRVCAVCGTLLQKGSVIPKTSSKPGTDTDKPGTDTDKPGTDTDKPGTDTDKPGTDTDKPGTDTDKPGTDTDKPGTDTDKPGTDTDEPGKETDEPGTDTDEPGTDTDRPGKETDKPGNETDKPGTGTDEPGTDTDKPDTDTDEPGTEDDGGCGSAVSAAVIVFAAASAAFAIRKKRRDR